MVVFWLCSTREKPNKINGLRRYLTLWRGSVQWEARPPDEPGAHQLSEELNHGEVYYYRD